MARKGGSLVDPFGKYGDDDKNPKNPNEATVGEKDEETPSTSKDSENLSYESSMTVEEVKKDLLSKYEEKSKRKTVEETHTRTTFLFNNELSKRLDKLSKGKKRGFKTMFMNKAIQALLDEME